MTRVLLTGGSGFIAAHVLDFLLERGHSVVTTVRSQAKADHIKQAHANVPAEKLGFVIVPDIAQPGAFDKAVVSNPPFEAVIHTASPFHFASDDPLNDLFPPAINGTVGILEAIKKFAPTVKTVIVTSSFASVMNASLPNGHVYTEADWNPVKKEEVGSDAITGYMASKTYAEKAAWEFMEKAKPSFTLTTICPPYVFGPVVHYLNSLSAINTSNKLATDLYTGAHKDQCPASWPNSFFVDVRDTALAHVLAIEKPQTAGKRIITAGGTWGFGALAEIIGQHFPEARSQLPADLTPGKPAAATDRSTVDNSFSRDVLGLKFRPLSESLIDLINSVKKLQP